MKKTILLAAFALCCTGAFAQTDNDAPEKDLNDALKDINASNPLPVSHQAIEQSTDENDREINKSSDQSNSDNNSKSSSGSTDDPRRRKR